VNDEDWKSLADEFCEALTPIHDTGRDEFERQARRRGCSVDQPAAAPTGRTRQRVETSRGQPAPLP
jgi:hypothetical protein